MLSLIAALVIAAPVQESQLTEARHFAPRTTGGRQPVHTDPVELRIVSGLLEDPMTDAQWSSVTADENGRFRGNGYFYSESVREAETVRILQAQGNSVVYVNGEIRLGDVYGYGYLRLPVLLKKGVNSFLFLSSRGGFI